VQTQRRSSRIYYYQYHYERHWRDIKSDTNEEKLFHERFPKPLIYDQHAKKLYQIFESIPAPERPENKCLERASGAKIVFKGGVAPYDVSYAFPIRYMFTFWSRRELEGTSEFADYALRMLIQVLSK